MARKDETRNEEKANKPLPQATLPTVGQPLDGRHFLDVTEEQQFAGKPYVQDEQRMASKEDSETRKEKEGRNGKPG